MELKLPSEQRKGLTLKLSLTLHSASELTIYFSPVQPDLSYLTDVETILEDHLNRFDA